jgi:hypothetical protein
VFGVGRAAHQFDIGVRSGAAGDVASLPGFCALDFPISARDERCMAGFVRFGVGLAVLLALSAAAHATDLSVTPIYQTRPLTEQVTPWRGSYLGAAPGFAVGNSEPKLQDRVLGPANAWTAGAWPSVSAGAHERTDILVQGFAGR